MGQGYYENLTPMQLDALREIGNIGSGNAATALSDMLCHPVTIGVPRIQMVDYSAAVEDLGGPEQLMVGILLSLSGDVTGMMLFLLRREFAHMMLNTLTGSSLDETGVTDPMSQSAIAEVGNIMAASYVNALVALTGLEIQISTPSVCIDMAGALLSVPAIYYANISDYMFLIEDDFNHQDDSSSSHMFLIPEEDGLQKIMESLGLDTWSRQ